MSISLNKFGELGASGETLALIGIALLWTYRIEVFQWLREVYEIWTGHISGRDLRVTDPLYSRKKPRRPRRALVLAGALTLIFVGQILLLWDLTF